MNIDFSKSADGLVPAIIQDAHTNVVLMQGYMNEAALNKTMEEGKVVFYSRSKKRLWMKGETSANYLYVDTILADCDNDSLLIKARPAGPVCHNGTDTCFNEANDSTDFLDILERIIACRKDKPSAGSYVSGLFQKGMDKIAQKVGEEAIELVIEAKNENIDLFKNEAADLLFHYLICLQAKGLTLEDIRQVLKSRDR
jgi:phosphoribosyl-ATP pyrophosphohydrolase/phosphoribosyl-AMP cyclohydrolase